MTFPKQFFMYSPTYIHNINQPPTQKHTHATVCNVYIDLHMIICKDCHIQFKFSIEQIYILSSADKYSIIKKNNCVSYNN